MSVDTVPTSTHTSTLKERGLWSLSWHGVRTVAALELRQRVRSTRWKVALVVWFVVVGALTAIASGALGALLGGASSPDVLSDEPVVLGPVVFGIVVFFVLFLGLLVAPTLSSSAINGDRNAGTLATLQVTLLSGAEIVVGKLLAAWLAAVAFLAASIPFIVWAVALGGVSALSLVSTIALLAVLLAVMCAIGLGFSAVVTKASGSAVLTYLTAGGLVVGSLVFFGLTTPLTVSHDEVRVWTVPSDYAWPEDDSAPPPCEWETQVVQRTHTERTWWLLAVNPFVIVADAAPPTRRYTFDSTTVDPLSAIRLGVRAARTGPGGEEDWCGNPSSPVAEPEFTDAPVWPWGLGFHLLLGATGVVTAVRRLGIPYGKLPRGTRVA